MGPIRIFAKKIHKAIQTSYFDYIVWPREVAERGRVYSQAKEIYVTEGNKSESPHLSPEMMRVEVVMPGDTKAFLSLPSEYFELVNKLARDADEQMKYIKNISFAHNPTKITGEIPELLEDLVAYKEKTLVKWHVKDVSTLPAIDEVCHALVPLIEKHIYHSYVSVEAPFVYYIRESAVERKGSSLWHSDNHHVDSLKVMIYLHEVTADMGALEYLVDQHGVPMYVPVQRPEKYPGGRLNEKEMASLEAEGYRRVKAIGPCGTTVFFSENMVHRGNIPLSGIRKVLLLQFKPSLKKQTSFIAPS